MPVAETASGEPAHRRRGVVAARKNAPMSRRADGASGKCLKPVAYCYCHEFTMWRRRLAGIYRYAHEAGWFVIPVEAKELRGFLRTDDFMNTVGLIVESGLLSREYGFRAGDFHGKATAYCAGDNLCGGWRVVHDSDDVARSAMDALLSLKLDSYAYVGYRVEEQWSRAREKVFFRMLQGRGAETAVFDACRCARTGARVAMLSDFYGPLKEWLAGLRKPCGLFAANDEMGAHVLRAANELGIAVPDALSVIGVDDDELLCENCTPPLASVSADFERSGWLAAQLLERQLRSPSARPQLAVFGDSAVVVRPSLGLFAKRDATVFRAIEFIRLNACGAIGVEDVARKMGCCRRSAEQRFKRTTGHSISDELLAVRLSKAKALLSDARIPIEHVHAACGYRDGRSLRYVFARATGMSLRDWRAKNQLRASSANPLRGGIP